MGIKYALAQETNYILLLNNDTVVAFDFIKPLVEVSIHDQSVGIAGPKIYYYLNPAIAC